ncbi:MAG: hypothetical protein DRQ98_11490 [Gammaproteobacteria bacterium]|nr:MAG: hypothetical protein DRQ98_11490 [Gammaproteobacteria bacterium]
MPIIAAGIIGGASLLGGVFGNKASAKQSQAQMDFQGEMSRTAHQREVKDLRAAGLNPILSGTGGRGASTPSGAQAPQKDPITPAVTSALAAKRQALEIKLLDAQSDKTYSETQGQQNKNVSTALQAWIDGGLLESGKALAARAMAEAGYDKKSITFIINDLLDKLKNSAKGGAKPIRLEDLDEYEVMPIKPIQPRSQKTPGASGDKNYRHPRGRNK